MKQIHFIVNPVSGSGRHKITRELLFKYFNSNEYNISIKNTEYAGHATELTQNSIQEKANIIVACGGDGTINEVASCLVNKDILLGIIPVGSGNGLASNLSISKNIQKAITVIKNETIKKIDVGQINTTYFFSNTGVGFDADVIFNYEEINKRRFSAYLRAVIKSFRKYSTHDKIEICIDEKTQVIKPFMVFVSNSNEMGYNMSLTPDALLDDGLLDVIIIPQIKRSQMLYLGLLFLLKKAQTFKHLQYAKTKCITLYKKKNSSFWIQKDGERHIVNSDTLVISIFDKSLNVITPL